MSEPRIIKRYANRKLYDTQHSCYVTLDQISEMIREGEDVRIIDNNSKEDLTSVTLAQIIFEEEKKQRLLPLAGLRAIIQTSGESIQDFVTQIKGEVDTRTEQVKKVFRRNRDGKVVEVNAEGDETPVADAELAVATAAADDADKEVEKAKSAAAFRTYLQSSQRRLDEFQSQLDQQVQKIVGNINPIPRMIKDLQTAIERLDDLEKRLGDLESKR